MPNAQPPSNLWQAFQATVVAHPERVALDLPDASVSFAELSALAERGAAWLAKQGIGRGDVVAIQLSKRQATYPLWLACLRQGAPYVFVDPRNPPQRTESILNRVRPALFLTTSEQVNAHGHTVRLPAAEDTNWLAALPSATAQIPPAAPVHGLSPAYIMFTSGSTGEPKGAVIPHQGVLSLMRWSRNHVASPDSARFSNINPLHFDNSVFDLYCGLLNGATLVPVDTAAAANPMLWIRRLRNGAASVIFAVPTLFLTLDKIKLLTPESLPDAKIFLFGGEGFPIEALRAFHARFLGHARLINVYGPTETSCICSSIEIDAAQLAAAGGSFASLGRMHADFDHAILDDAGMPAASGELWIGGACVGLGYYANPAETAMRFRQDPRHNDYRSLWYRSGDLVRQDEDGLLWFLGRADNQVKIRGHRIEIEEIDLAVEQMSGVSRAICVAVYGADGLELRLAVSGEASLSIDQIRDHCSASLPSYMQPATIVKLDAMPQNANGKADRRAIQAILETAI
jgi:D-alanine--poly(phosphoribitol) ligase subunit 1